jgi:hypothetical protein
MRTVTTWLATLLLPAAAAAADGSSHVNTVKPFARGDILRIVNSKPHSVRV